MKKKFVIAIFGCLTITLPVASLQAQDHNLLASNRRTYTPGLTAAYDLSVVSYKSHVGVYVRAKVMRTFLRYFADATDVRWHLSNNQYFASFKQGNRLCKALFDYTGGLIYAIHYGNEKDLPKVVRKQLTYTYADYTVSAVLEVDANNVKSWIVHLQDADNLIVVQVTDSTLDELHHYKTHF